MKRITKKILALLLSGVLACGLLTSCCGNETPYGSGEGTQSQSSSTSGSSAAEGTSGDSTEVSIVDVMGRTVTLPQPASKLVGTHNPTLNQAVILGGGGKYLVGFGNKNMAGGLYSYVYPELDDVVQIGKGQDINFESCLAVGADLAILPERFAHLAEEFEAIGIPAAVVLPNVESYDTIRSSLRLVAALIGEEERAEDIIAFFDAKMDAAEEITATITEKPDVLYLGGNSPLSVANGIMLQSVMIETVGANNVAKDVEGQGDFVEVSIEEIIGWNPDVIYIPTFASYTVEDILNDPAWSSIQAVKDEKVYVFPSTLEPRDYPTPSASMGLTWLIHNLYPEKYSLDQVLEDANTYYDMVYGQTFTAEQLGIE